MAFTGLRLHRHLRSSLSFLPTIALPLMCPLAFFFSPGYVTPPLILPSMDYLVFISLSRLWERFLTWLTLPYLFLVLNTIIILLSATSGIFRKSCSVGLAGLHEGEAEQEKLQSWSCFSPGHVMTQFAMSPWRKRAPPPGQVVSRREIARENAATLTQAARSSSRDFPNVFRQPLQMKGENLQSNVSCRNRVVPIVSTNEMKKVVSEGASVSICEVMVEQKEEEPNGGGGSELCSTSSFVTPAKNIMRSLAFDSARSLASEQQELSDEAFRQRVDDFITRMNARFREI